MVLKKRISKVCIFKTLFVILQCKNKITSNIRIYQK
nr:MAG TPA: hypothetical protein [Caudoviricetes sp.]